MRTLTYWLILALAIIMSGSALAQDAQTINGIMFTLPEGYQINEQTDGLFGGTFVRLSDARTLDSPPPEQRTLVFSLITPFDNPQGLDNQAVYAQLRDGFIQNYGFT